MFVCFLIFSLIYNCKEIREGDYLSSPFWLKLINRAAQKKIFLKLHPSPPPPNPSQSQAVRAQWGGVEKGQHVSTPHQPGAFDYATMP